MLTNVLLFSVATVDYDYSKAYGGGGEASVVSSAGGTFGSNAQGASQLDPAIANATGALGGAGSFEDDSFSPFAGNTKEELIDVFAPPGKLGVVIDTPDDGAPVVHAVKSSSVIADKIRVGDKLVAVDDEDVRSMTAIKVSKLISRKSANSSRKLSLIRTTKL
jgi:membrane-associated protease RseP (regulator of RpoE activity)